MAGKFPAYEADIVPFDRAGVLAAYMASTNQVRHHRHHVGQHLGLHKVTSHMHKLPLT